MIFEDDAEFYWARARILEKLSSLSPGTLPDGEFALGPDATALGQIFGIPLRGKTPTGMRLAVGTLMSFADSGLVGSVCASVGRRRERGRIGWWFRQRISS